MRCDEAKTRIGMLHDGELANGEREAVTAHAAQCPECARYRDELGRLSRHLRQVRETAPLPLLERVRANLEVEAAEEAAPPAAPWSERPARRGPFTGATAALARRMRPYMLQMAAVLVACAISAGGTAWWMQQAQTTQLLAEDVLAAHMRALLQDNAVQVASLDTHTVKPWFAGRLEYTPLVKDLTAEGFQLIGGRLDYVDGRRVAALVYRRRLHQISLFVWPAHGEAAAPASTVIDGYNVLSWNKGGMTFWAVSDLGSGELGELRALL